MKYGLKKSDLAKVAEKPTNKADSRTAAEWVEPRAGTEGNADQQSTHRTQCRARVSQALARVRQAARARKKERFTALLHHINMDLLRLSFYALKRSAAPGVDGVTWKDYEAALESNLRGLHERVQRGAYRALPSRRRYIPKPDGRQRPLGIAALEDKLLQRAVVAVLNAIYEEDFLGFSYGFRPKRSQHDALDALMVGIQRRKVNWILDADYRSFFDTVSHSWLLRFLEHRIGDERILRLIRKWLKAGVLEAGIVTESEAGTPQGATVTPRTQKITWSRRCHRRTGQPVWCAVRSRRGNRNGVANGDCVRSDQNFSHDQPQDLLAFAGVHRLGAPAEFAAKRAQAISELQVFRLINCRHLQRL